jgi:putative salt-induced outer membrane protein YdiY
MRFFTRICVAGVFLLAATTSAIADELILKNGDRLTGTVDTLADGKLTFKTAKAGTVVIAVSEIKSLTTDNPVKMVLADKTKVTAKIGAGSDGKFMVDVNGQNRELEFAQLGAINPPAFRWTGGAAAGLTLLSNLINTRTISVTGNANRLTSTTEATFDAAYLTARQGDVETENAAFLNGDYTFGKQRRLFGFVNGGLRTDRIQQLDIRAILGAGVGYEWLQGGNKQFRTDVGLSYRGERFRGQSFNNLLAAQLGYKFRWNLRKGTDFTHDLLFLPTLSDLGDNYLLAQFGLDQSLVGNLYFNARVILDRTSRPGPNAAQATSKIILGIGARF